MYDLKTYPSAKEIVHAWRQGIKAQRMARLAGLHKADDEEDKGDHDEGDDGDDDDTSSLPKWFMNPYKDVSLTQYLRTRLQMTMQRKHWLQLRP